MMQTFCDDVIEKQLIGMNIGGADDICTSLILEA